MDTIQLVASGRIDMGWVGLGPMAVAREAGLKVKSVAGVFRKGDLAVIVDESSKINLPKDLAGKKIGVFTASTWVPFIDPFLRTAGLSKNDVEMVYVAPPTLMATYASGAVDAILSLGPYATPMVNARRKSRAIFAADYGIVYPSFGLMLREDTITERRASVEKVVRTVLRAWRYVYDGHEDEAIDAMMAQRSDLNLDRNVLLGQLNLYRNFQDTDNTRGKAIGWQSDKDWEEAIKSMENAGLLKAGRKPDEFFTNEFVN